MPTIHIELPSNVDRNQSLSEKDLLEVKWTIWRLALADSDLTYECVVDEQLEEMENDKNWEECVQVDVKTKAPLDVLWKHKKGVSQIKSNLISVRGLEQEGVAHPPEQAGNH